MTPSIFQLISVHRMMLIPWTLFLLFRLLVLKALNLVTLVGNMSYTASSVT
ncbi:hypothetical protein F4604DRAFT_1623612, partial [Suillus subluteus]